MKFLVVGLGSMGKRRIRNLKQLGHTDVIGFDTRGDRCKEANEKYQISAFTDISNALKENPNAMVISTTPDLHMKYAKVAIKNKVHFFTEASVVQDDMEEIYSVLLEFQNGIRGNLTVDVIARFPYRQLKILGEDGVIFADWSDRTIGYYTKEAGWKNTKIDDGGIEKNYIHGDGPYV